MNCQLPLDLVNVRFSNLERIINLTADITRDGGLRDARCSSRDWTPYFQLQEPSAQRVLADADRLHSRRLLKGKLAVSFAVKHLAQRLKSGSHLQADAPPLPRSLPMWDREIFAESE